MSMAKEKRLTYENAVLVWELLQGNTKPTLIIKATGVSSAIVMRVREIFTAASKGDVDAVTALYDGHYQHIKGYAIQYFNLTPSIKEEQPPASLEKADRMEDIYRVLCGISYGITKMNEKLEKLCEAWEVNK